MTVQHSSLTGSELHEPKGAATAPSGSVYVADGAGSGSWADPLSEVKNLNTFCLNDSIADISTANSNFLMVIPRACELFNIKTVMSSAITGSDAVISIYINNVLQGQSITISQAGSGARVTDELDLSPVYSLSEGDVLELRTDGGSTDTSRLFVTLCFTAV